MTTQAQPFKVSWADNTKIPKHEPQKIIGSRGDKIYVLQDLFSRVSFDMQLQVFNSAMKTVFIKPLPILADEKKGKSQFIDAQIIDDNIFYFYRLHEKDASKDLLLMSMSDMEGTMQGQTMQLAEEPTLGRSQTAFSIIPSPDSVLYLVLADTPDKRREYVTFNFKVLFRNMQDVIWAKEIKLPYTAKEFYGLRGLQVDNMGNVFMLIEVKKDSREKGESKNLFKILRYENPDGSLKEYDLELPGLSVYSANLNVDKMGNLNCAGFYRPSKGSGNKENGYFSVELSGAGNVKNRQTTELKDLYSDDMVKKNISEKQLEKAKSAAASSVPYRVHTMLPREKGGHFVVAEQENIYTYRTTNSKGMPMDMTRYTNNDVLVMALDKDGELEWHGVVPKHQMTEVSGHGVGVGFVFFSGPIYSSFPTHSIVAASKNDKVYMIYNAYSEHVNYTRQRDLIRKKKGKRAVIVATVSEGKVKRQVLFTKKESKLFVYPSLHKVLENGDILFSGKIGFTKSKIGKLTLPN